ncbi:MAG: hypothetical protein QOJ97_2913 [Solirubrobacteraceae bacterium]|nr:hypothetical protein [Solirubrobacteraceae bacterium]
MLATILILADNGATGDQGGLGAVAAVALLLGAIAVIALVWFLVARRTRSERTRHGTHPPGPGRS